MSRQIGRPLKTDERQIVDLDECIALAQAELRMSKPPFCRRTLRNKISRGEFQRFGTYKHPMVDWLEVKRSLHWRRKAV